MSQPYGQSPYAPQSYPPPQGFPPQQPYAPPQGYPAPQAYAPQQPYPQAHSQPWQAPACRFCGGFPAVQATVRGHQGMLVIMRLLRLKGPFCRRCGIAAHRNMTTDTMWQGWWSFASILIGPLTLLYNLIPRARFNKLPEPQPGHRPPMDTGKPIFQRPGAWGILLPVLLWIGLYLCNRMSYGG